jgi:ornithine cyclodeaminase/alanine dehydrogenase
VVTPTKVGLDHGETAEFPPYEGFKNAMPANIGWLDSAGIKWAGGFLGERKKRGLPYITSLILLIDPKIGNFRAVMDGAYITNMRTGAQTAVALKYLHPGKNLKLGLFGAGMQGHTQTMAIAELFHIDEVHVYDISPEASRKYAEDMKDTVQGKIVIAKTPEEAATSADVVVCVTQSKDKYVKDAWIKPGGILFPMGSYQECEDAYILNADRIIVDHVGQCLHRGALKELSEAGKITEKNIYATIGEIVAGKKKGPGPSSERTLCIPIGTGAMDIAVASIALKKAEEKGIGGSSEFA